MNSPASTFCGLSIGPNCGLGFPGRLQDPIADGQFHDFASSHDAANECTHGHLPHDTNITCGCWATAPDLIGALDGKRRRRVPTPERAKAVA